MRLFIRIKNGKPFEHPIVEDNFRQAFPHIDPDNLPPEFAEFIRGAPPAIDRFEVYEGVEYKWNGYAYKDHHKKRPMNGAEKAAEIAKIKGRKPKESWVWDEEKLTWQPPKRPTIGGPWRFDPVAKDWVIATEPPFPSWVISEDGTHYTAPTPRPQDGNRYRWDEPTLSWVQVNV
jgi:hypothetical protein